MVKKTILPFAKILVLFEMQLTMFRIWTRVDESFYYDGEHFATSTFSINQVPKLFFHKDGFGIRYPREIYIQRKQTKPKYKQAIHLL